MNAPVAPSPGKELGRDGSGLSTGTLGDGGIAGVGGAGITTGVSGAAKTGSGTGVAFIGGAAGKCCAGSCTTPPCIGAGASNDGWGVPMSLNIPVKLGPEALGGAGVAEDEGVAPPNTAVNSPTFFFGGSIGSDE